MLPKLIMKGDAVGRYIRGPISSYETAKAVPLSMTYEWINI
jgi:hypothetical protein